MAIEVPLWISILGLSIGGALFLVSGMSKLINPQPVVNTLTVLFKRPSSSLGAYALGLVETAAALVVTLLHGVMAAALVTLLGAAFAGAGALALVTGVSVECGCYGRVGKGNLLGRSQLYSLPAWLLLALLSLNPALTTLSFGGRILVLAVSCLSAMAVVAPRVVSEMMTVRRMRLSLRPYV